MRFTNHDIYNISRHLLYHYKPQRFLVDARTQIGQTRTGNPVKRAIYYLKRGYYPPDQKGLADRCLIRLARGKRVGAATIRKLLRASRSPFWIYPVGEYVDRRSYHRSLSSRKAATPAVEHGCSGKPPARGCLET